MAGPLHGFRILDLTSVVLGPYATMTLGDLGADIVKIEAPEGDMLRGIGQGRHKGMGPMHLAYNRNKRSIVLDLKQPEGRDALLKLAAGADALVHNMRPQAMAALKLGYDDLRAVKPDIVYCGAYGYSVKGPYAARPAFDDVIQSVSGMAALMGNLFDGPRYAPTVVADKTTGLTLVYALLAGLIHRLRTGEGQFIEVPMFETMVSFLMTEHLWGHSFVPPIGPPGYTRVLAPERKPDRTKDGWVSLLPYTDRNWRDFFRIAGRPELIDDPRFGDITARTRHVRELYAIKAEAAPRYTTQEWLDFCEQRSIPAAKVNSLDELFEDPHLKAVGFFSESEHPSEGRVTSLGIPVRFEGTPGNVRHPAPRLGEHSQALLREAGLTEAEIADLLAKRAAIQS